MGKTSPPRLRIFAGPNGSGKSLLSKALKNPADKRIKIGVFVNADEIEKVLNTSGFLDLKSYKVSAGDIVPPEPTKVLQLMYQFINNLNYKIENSKSKVEQIECLVYAHHEFIKIHPFNNGNGRTGRILMNIIALKFGYKPLELYYRHGDSRKIYIDAMKSADKGNFEPLTDLVSKELTAF